MKYKHTLHVDIETRSSADISATGSYKYAQDKDFEILLISYAFDGDPVHTIDLKGPDGYKEETLRYCNQFFPALNDPNVLKLAYNAAFEWYCLNTAGFETPLDQWQCVMAHGLYCGYPAGLAAIGDALWLPQDKQKMMAGKALIRYFCTPAKPTKKNGGRPWNDPQHDIDKWILFTEYNKQDVEVEREVAKRLSNFPMPGSEIELWRRDVLMNARGARVDRKLIEGALYCDAECTAALIAEAQQITGLDNPNSNTQLMDWLNMYGYPMPNLQKATVAEALEDDLDDNIRRVLEIRQQLGKTSNKKYQAAADAICEDDRVRGLLQYYGANRTGRWAGRLVQIQNLPR